MEWGFLLCSLRKLNSVSCSNVLPICHVDPKERLNLKDWAQTEKEILVELQAGDGIRDNDVELTVTAKHCKLKLRGEMKKFVSRLNLV